MAPNGDGTYTHTFRPIDASAPDPDDLYSVTITHTDGGVSAQP